MIHVRWMIRRDWKYCLDIERTLFKEPWTETEFIQNLRNRLSIAVVAEEDETILGHCFYLLSEDDDKPITILRLVAVPSIRRDIETCLIKYMLKKNRRLLMYVTDDQTETHLLLKANGFIAVGVERGDPDVYKFELLAENKSKSKTGVTT